jgi:hypothetical protein
MDKTFTKEFCLTVTIKGENLHDVDNGLIEAAGERLKARIVNNPVQAVGAQMPEGLTINRMPPEMKQAIEEAEKKRLKEV